VATHALGKARHGVVTAGAGSFADAFVSISIDPGVNAKRGPIINIDAGDDATIAGGTSTSSGFCDPLASSGS
jgi:hypothetical protein